MNFLELANSFDRDARALGASRDAEHVFARLIAAYAEPHRAYHTLTHIVHGLGEFDALGSQLAEPSLIRFAYWFHDAVYAAEPSASNEADSADLAAQACAALGISDAVVADLRELILATKTHELPNTATQIAMGDMQALLDVDLSIFATDTYTFAAFERDVRFEYAWVPRDDLFVAGRRAVMTRFLERPRIYQRADLHARWDATARQNLKRLVATLDAALRGEVDAVDATDTCIFSTFKGRLAQAHAWEEVAGVALSDATSDGRTSVIVNFHSPAAAPLRLDAVAATNLRLVEYLGARTGFGAAAWAAAIAALPRPEVG